jgi:hypothetical protein
MAQAKVGEQMNVVKEIKEATARLRQIFFPLGGEFAGSKIELTPIPDDILNTSAAEVLANPSQFPKLRR